MAESKGHTELPSAIWMRDLDGTGSMHPCAKGDPGAITYVPEDSVNTYPAVAELVKALEGTEEAIDSWRQALSASDMRHLSEDERAILVTQHDVIRSALTRFREAQAGGGE